MWHVVVTVCWPGDMALLPCCWCALVWLWVVGCVTLMVVCEGQWLLATGNAGL